MKHSQQSGQSPVPDNPSTVFHPTVFSHHIRTGNYIFLPFSNASDIEILFYHNNLGSFPATPVFPYHHICNRHKVYNTAMRWSEKKGRCRLWCPSGIVTLYPHDSNSNLCILRVFFK